MKSETPVVINTARTKAYAKSVRALRTATTSGYDTPSTLSHVGELSSIPVGTLVRILILSLFSFDIKRWNDMIFKILGVRILKFVFLY